MLRERLAQREQRISELKAAMAASQPDLTNSTRQLAAANTSVTAVRLQAATQTLAQSSASAAEGDPPMDHRRSVAVQAGSAGELAATASGPEQGIEQEQRANVQGEAADQTHALTKASPACTLQEREASADSLHICPGASSRDTLDEAPALALPSPKDIPAEPETHPAAPEPQSPNAKHSSRDSEALILHGGPDSTGAPAAAAAVSFGSPQRELAEAVADLRLELACRDAEIEHLQGTLTQVVAASQAEANRPSSAASAYEQVCTTKDFPIC